MNPLVRISFDWALKDLEAACLDGERQQKFTNAEHGFVFSIYLVSVVSLSEEDCSKELHQPRTLLRDNFHMLCEEALSRTNLFRVTDIVVLKALTIYMVI